MKNETHFSCFAAIYYTFFVHIICSLRLKGTYNQLKIFSKNLSIILLCIVNYLPTIYFYIGFKGENVSVREDIHNI